MIADDSKNADSVKKAAEELLPLGIPGAIPVAKAPDGPIIKRTDPKELGALPLKNRKHEAFCMLVAYPRGDFTIRTFAEAYQEAFPGTGINSARANASRLKKNHPEIVARIAFLSKEMREEILLSKGAVFANTVNGVADVFNAMQRRKSDPRCASVALNAANLLLKATGVDAPQTQTVEETVEAESAKSVNEGLLQSLKRVVRVKRTVTSEE